MTKIFNRRELRGRRKYLRNNMTPAEVILRSHIKNSQLVGLKFRRQASIKNYIVDFYCPSKKLAVELDGDVHAHHSRILSDTRRQQEIEELGIKVVRFTNSEVRKNIQGVLLEIIELAGIPGDQPPLGPLLEKEGKDEGPDRKRNSPPNYTLLAKLRPR